MTGAGGGAWGSGAADAGAGEEDDEDEWVTDDGESDEEDDDAGDFPSLAASLSPKKADASSARGQAQASTSQPSAPAVAPTAPPAEPAAGQVKTPFGSFNLPVRLSKPTAAAEAEGQAQPTQETQTNGAAKKPAVPSLPPRGGVGGLPRKANKEATRGEVEAKATAPTAAGANGGASSEPPPAQQAAEEGEEKSEAEAAPKPTAAPTAAQRMQSLLQQAGAAPPPSPPPAVEELSEEKQALARTVMDYRVKLVRIAKRLGVGVDNHVIRQVIFRLDMTEQIKLHGESSRGALRESLREAQAIAEAKDAEGTDLEVECRVLVIGKSAVGKSSLIKNLLGIEEGSEEDAAVWGKKRGGVVEVTGEVSGVKMTFLDVPGLQSSTSEAKRNRRTIQAAKRACRKSMPDIVLYVDRLDVPSYDFADIPLLREVTHTFGPAVWWNALLVFTHGGARAPEDSAGQVANFEYYQNHRGYVVQQMIRQVAGDARILNPVSVVETHHATKRNDRGDKLLPNGQAWKPYVLLLCFASKVLHDANVALKLDSDAKDNQRARQRQMMALRRQQTPYPVFFNNLFHPRKPRRVQGADAFDEEQMEVDMAEGELGMPGGGEDYPLNPFKNAADAGDNRIDIPAPDPALAPSFDCDASTHQHRYRYLENSNGWICRAIVEPDGYEHDDGINGFTSENYYGHVADPGKPKPIPTYVMAQVNMPDKDKLSFVTELESTVTHTSGKKASQALQAEEEEEGAKGKGKQLVTTGGIDVQSLGRDVMYVARAETRVKHNEQAKMCGGVSVFRSASKLPHAGPLAVGAKVEERLKLGRRMKLNVTAGALGGKAADGKTNQYVKGANVQFVVKGNKKKGEPTKLNVTGTAMHWKRELAMGGDVQVVQMVGPDSALTCRANLNSRGTGTVQVRLTSTDTMKYALAGVLPALSAIWGFLTGAGDL